MASRVPMSKPRRTGSLAIMNQAMQRRLPPDPRTASMQPNMGPQPTPQSAKPMPQQSFGGMSRLPQQHAPQSAKPMPTGGFQPMGGPPGTQTGQGVGMSRHLGQQNSQMDWVNAHPRQWSDPNGVGTGKFNDRMMNADKAANMAQYSNLTPTSAPGQTQVSFAPTQQTISGTVPGAGAPGTPTAAPAPAPAPNSALGLFDQFKKAAAGAGPGSAPATGTSGSGLGSAPSASAPASQDTSPAGQLINTAKSAGVDAPLDAGYGGAVHDQSKANAVQNRIDPAYAEWLWTQGIWISQDGQPERVDWNVVNYQGQHFGNDFSHYNGENLNPNELAGLMKDYGALPPPGGVSGTQDDANKQLDEAINANPNYNQAERDAATAGELEADRINLAKQQGDAMKVAFERGGRAGISPEAALANQGAQQQQMGVAGANSQAQIRANAAKTNLQLQISDNQQKYQLAMAKWNRTNQRSDLELAQRFQQNAQMLQMQLQNQASQITPGDVGMALLGIGGNIASAGIGSAIGGLAGGAAAGAGRAAGGPSYSVNSPAYAPPQQPSYSTPPPGYGYNPYIYG